MNSLVLSDEQRRGAANPVIQQLIPMIPRANYFDADGTARFVGSAPAVADVDSWTIDVRHSAGTSGRIHMFYGAQKRRAREPTAQGNSIPGFGSVQRPLTSVLTVGETHMFGGGSSTKRASGAPT